MEDTAAGIIVRWNEMTVRLGQAAPILVAAAFLSHVNEIAIAVVHFPLHEISIRNSSHLSNSL